MTTGPDEIESEESFPTPDSQADTSEAARFTKLEKTVTSLKQTVTSLKRRVTITVIIGVIVGGGGAVGVFQWIYAAPTKKAVDQAQAKATNLDSELKLHNNIIDSLQRSLGRIDPEANKERFRALESRLEKAEEALRVELEKHSKSLLEFQSIANNLKRNTDAFIEKYAASIDQVTADAASKKLIDQVAADVDRYRQVTERALADLSSRIAELKRAFEEIQRQSNR